MDRLKSMLKIENKSPVQRPQAFAFCHECLKGEKMFYKIKRLFVLHKDGKYLK